MGIHKKFNRETSILSKYLEEDFADKCAYKGILKLEDIENEIENMLYDKVEETEDYLSALLLESAIEHIDIEKVAEEIYETIYETYVDHIDYSNDKGEL